MRASRYSPTLAIRRARLTVIQTCCSPSRTARCAETAGRRTIRRPEQQWHAEHDQPDARHRPGDAVVLMRLRGPSRKADGSGSRPPRVTPEAGNATPNSITTSATSVPRLPIEMPRPERPPIRCGLRDRRQHGVVEHLGELKAGRQDDDQGENDRDRQAALRARHREPKREATRRHDGDDGGEPGLSAARTIRDSAENGRQQRDAEADDRVGETPGFLAAHRVADDRVGEVRREHEDVDQAEIGRAREVKHRPRELRRAARRSLSPVTERLSRACAEPWPFVGTTVATARAPRSGR